MKQALIILSLLLLSCYASAQTSSVQVNSAGKIIVPSNGTLTSPGTITGNAITSNGTTTTNALTLTSGNISDSNGDVIISDDMTVGGNISLSSYRLTSNDLVLGADTVYSRAGIAIYGASTFQVNGTNLQFYTAGGYCNMNASGVSGVGTLAGNFEILSTAGIRFSSNATTGTYFLCMLSASVTYDCPSISANSSTTTDITVTGATTTNTPTVDCTASDETQYAGLIRRAWVVSSNTVRVHIFNPTAGAINPGSVTLRVKSTQF